MGNLSLYLFFIDVHIFICYLLYRSVVLYNSLTHDREGVFSLLVDSPSVLVQDVHGNVLPIQIDPIWEKHDHYSDFNYKVKDNSYNDRGWTGRGVWCRSPKIMDDIFFMQ